MKLIMIASVLLISSFAYAGKEGGNGGNGLLLNGHVYLLDLVQAGLEEKVFEPTPQCANQPDLTERLARTLDQTRMPLQLISAKICEIKARYPLYARLLLSAIELYDWRFVNTFLNDTDDDDSDVAEAPGQHVQLAVRSERTIRLASRYWPYLSPTHQAALVIHEAVYATSPVVNSDLPLPHPKPYDQYEGVSYYKMQDSRVVRDIVGLFFDGDLRKRNSAQLASVYRYFWQSWSWNDDGLCFTEKCLGNQIADTVDADGASVYSVGTVSFSLKEKWRGFWRDGEWESPSLFETPVNQPAPSIAGDKLLIQKCEHAQKQHASLTFAGSVSILRPERWSLGASVQPGASCVGFSADKIATTLVSIDLVVDKKDCAALIAESARKFFETWTQFPKENQ